MLLDYVMSCDANLAMGCYCTMRSPKESISAISVKYDPLSLSFVQIFDSKKVALRLNISGFSFSL